jgi:K(+)-stimulated pyrophosphate-energized sodium pump
MRGETGHEPMHCTARPCILALSIYAFVHGVLAVRTAGTKAEEPPLLSIASITDIPSLFYVAPAAGIVALITANLIARSVRARSEGDVEMIRVAAAVRQGAMAYLKRQYRVVAIVFAALIAVLAVLSALHLQPSLSMIGVPIAGLLSGLCGWFGMRMATDASARTAAAAKESLNDGLTVAFRSGAVMGLNVVGFAILDISAWFIIFNAFGSTLGIDEAGGAGLPEITTIMLSFGMGASLQALFARVGGGIYTKAADVGADLVGKVEAGIPEDDPRNPATIADNVGDNVGDVAGMGADLYESYYGSILATLALGAVAAFAIPNLTDAQNAEAAIRLVAAPIALAGLGVLASIVGIFSVKTREDATFAELLASLNRGVYVASAIIILAAFAVPFLLFRDFQPLNDFVAWWRVGVAICAGLISGLVIARWTEYCTSYEHPPTKRIAEQALTGPATVIIAGIAEGMKSTWASLMAVVVAILVAFIATGGGESFLFGLYGVSIAAVGMLATLGITLATDAYGPIADNAGGNAEMSGQPPHVRERTDKLDSLGNTTAATGKGFAIGSAALTAMALLAAFVQVVQVQIDRQAVEYARVAATTNAVPTEKAAKPHAIYMGHGKFAMAVPGAGKDGGTAFSAAMLIDRQQPGADEMSHVPVGKVWSIALPEHHHGHSHDDDKPAADDALLRAHDIVATVVFDHGDHAHDLDLTLVTTRGATISDILAFYDVTIGNPRVLGGLFIGTTLVFLFCALTMSAVGRAAYGMMTECRRQFAIIRQALRAKGMSEADIANPDNWPRSVTSDGRDYPDYSTCVSIATAGAQREMVLPSLLAITAPLLVGLVLSVPGVIGLLAGALTSGFAVAVFMANAGGAWDNAKKLIESYGKITADTLLDDPATRARLPEEVRAPLVVKAEELRRAGRGSAFVYGKGSEDHKATVVGDTVGDPFKDTSGPSLNILIKLLSIVAVVFAGVVVKFGPMIGEWIGLS